MKHPILKCLLLIFLFYSGFQFFRISIQGFADFHFKPVISEIPKAYSLDPAVQQNSIANINQGAAWLELLNRIRFAIMLDEEQPRYHRWLGLAYTARAAAVPAGSELQSDLLFEADKAFSRAHVLNPTDPYVMEQLVLTAARIGRFDSQTEMLMQRIRELGPREFQVHEQVLREYLPRYDVLPPALRTQVDLLLKHLESQGGPLKMKAMASYSKQFGLCRLADPEADTLRQRLYWPAHVCAQLSNMARSGKGAN